MNVRLVPMLSNRDWTATWGIVGTHGEHSDEDFNDVTTRQDVSATDEGNDEEQNLP